MPTVSPLTPAALRYARSLTVEQYRDEREKRGTQWEVSALLGIARSTLARRETRVIPISDEAKIALIALPLKEPEK